MEELTWLSALLLGLMGAPHCAGMCGGIVGALSIGTRPGIQAGSSPFIYVIAYNSGRLFTYVVAGMLAGGISQFAGQMAAMHQTQLVLKSLAVVFMLFLGLYISGWWTLLTRLERLGSSVWKHIEPLGRRFIPVRSLPSALVVGMVWGWLPCGLVYTALIYTLTSGSAVQGGMMMLFFGLGTLPAMLMMGMLGARLQALLQNPRFRQAAGILVIGFALWMAYEVIKTLGI